MRLPPPLMVSEPGSFAESTIVRRKPQIVADVISHNQYPQEIVTALGAFVQEIATQSVAPLREDWPDVPFWLEQWRPWEGQSWRQLPWFFAETYFYRRLLEIVRYFQPGALYLQDPFEPQKRQALEHGMGLLAGFLQAAPGSAALQAEIALWLQHSLWGNRADLSNAQTAAKAYSTFAQDPGRLLIDHTEQVWELLKGGRVQRLDLVADNTGLELLVDLQWIALLLRHDLVREVHLHLKGQPYFVSDAMIKDFEASRAALLASPMPELSALGGHISAQQAAGRLAVHDHPFWATCLFYQQLPDDLRQNLANADLLVLKGDVNYRRLVEDRHWPPTSKLEDIAGHMPTSFVTLRTLKGEVIVGLGEGMAETLSQLDPQWLINGEHGIIHLVRRHALLA
jgi:uncharacterized protein with ATP-grasp and redox domains